MSATLVAIGAFIAGLATYLQSQLVTWIFVFVAMSLIVWMMRLHFDRRYKAFDLTKLIEQHDGSPDGEKIRVWATYIAGIYAFFFLLAHDRPAFLTYAPFFTGITFTHLVANRMTAKAQPPVQRPEPQ